MKVKDSAGKQFRGCSCGELLSAGSQHRGRAPPKGRQITLRGREMTNEREREEDDKKIVISCSGCFSKLLGTYSNICNSSVLKGEMCLC